MHILSDQYRAEFLASPDLVRTTLASRGEALEPALLVKSKSLNLKHLLSMKQIRVVLEFDENGHVAYGMQIDNDPENTAFLWSWAEDAMELQALSNIYSGRSFTIHLFNELAVNVASAEVGEAEVSSTGLNITFDAGVPQNIGYSAAIASPTPKFISTNTWSALQLGEIVVDSPSWTENKAHFIGRGETGHLVSLFHADEGNQQEELAFWLAHSLDTDCAYKSPQVQLTTKVRELTDVLLTSDRQTFLIESKTLSVLGSQTLPSRHRLERNLARHAKKAASQLAGAARSLRDGLPVTNEEGEEVFIDRDNRVHAIVLVPDLALLATSSGPDLTNVGSFMETTGGFLHFLDVAELLRVVQAAQILANYSQSYGYLETLDAYLTHRMSMALEIKSAIFTMILDSNALPNLAVRIAKLDRAPEADSAQGMGDPL